MHQIFAQARAWRSEIPTLRFVAIELPVRQIPRINLAQMLKQALREYGLPADYLVLAVTEKALMQSPIEDAALLAELSAIGLRIAVHGFGAGCTRLAYLKRFPLHALKIDQSIVQDIETNRDHAAVAAAMVAFAHELGLQVIVEKVKTDAQMRCLRKLGCDWAQGGLYGRPMPADELNQMLLKHA